MCTYNIIIMFTCLLELDSLLMDVPIIFRGGIFISFNGVQSDLPVEVMTIVGEKG